MPVEPDFETLFQEEVSYVWNVLRRLGVSERDLEDLTQQVFLQVYRQLAQYDPRRPLRPWLFCFALRAASNHRRLSRHRIELQVPPPDVADPAPGPDERLIGLEDRELAERALSQVPLERRAVLLLHEVDGQSIPAIADALSMPVNTAYSRLRLARQDYEKSVARLRLQRGDR
ncbi:MAG TPA: RNA polymerase sigma factor [Polyangiaceae bacterium]|jgi:RNA polymerase sigma-70 factor (ECF subfamily)